MPELFFDYELPERLIAQHPADRRDDSRLLVLNRAADTITHHHFHDLPQFLRPNDLLVRNDTKVIPARVVGVRANTGGKWEGLFLRELPGEVWELLAQTRGYPGEGEEFRLNDLTPRPPLTRPGEGEILPPPPVRGRSVSGVSLFSTSPLEGEVDSGAERTKREGGGLKDPPPANSSGVDDLPLKGGGERMPTPSGGGVPFTLTLVGRTADRHWLMTPNQPGSPADLLAVHGHIPLPPYIRKGVSGESDRERYQTVYAERVGSVAAPTAGLHFTPELLDALKTQGVNTANVTLHVGLGTFAPVKVDDPLQHAIHAEWAEVSADTADAINRTKATGGRVIAVGTTTTRTLETAARFSPPPLRGRSDGFAVREGGSVSPFRGDTALYIHPPFDFRVLDGLVTNFHLPKTTLLLLVQAFSGSDLLRRAYTEAIREEYRFFSYGDAMLVV